MAALSPEGNNSGNQVPPDKDNSSKNIYLVPSRGAGGNGRSRSPDREADDADRDTTLDDRGKADKLAERELLKRELAVREIQQMQTKIELLKRRYIIDEKLDEEKTLSGPLTPDEREQLKSSLLGLRKGLKQAVRGQDEAVDAVVSALERAAAGVTADESPIGSFLFIGRTGGGKTYLSEKLAELLGSKAAGLPFSFVPIDCSEYSQGFENSRLTGSPPGYVGSDKKNKLDEIIEKPYSVVLFDEIEKGSDALHNLLLQVLDRARATTAQGKKVSFERCIVIMTSNVGVQDLDQVTEEPIGFGSARETLKLLTANEVREVTAESLKNKFKPEFINRIDEVVPFKDLTLDVIHEIVGNELRKVARTTERNNDCAVRFTPDVRQLVVDLGYSREFQAREIKRAIKRYVANPLAQKILQVDAEDLAGGSLVVSVHDGVVKVSFTPLRNREAERDTKAA